jgi:anti-sigma B factor antagonist
VTGDNGPVVVTLAGELDIMSAPAVRERLLSLLSRGTSRLVVDMSAIRYADASGLAALVSTQRRAGLLGGELRLAAPRPEVEQMLAATGISRHIETYPTVKAAADGGQPPARPGPGTAVAHYLPVQAGAGRGADSGELRAAVAAVLGCVDAWRDADPERRFSPALRALAQAHASSSYAAMSQAAQSLLAMLSREPLTYSPAVAATASRLRRLFPRGPRLAAS